MKYYIDTEFLEGTQSTKRKDGRDLFNGAYITILLIFVLLVGKPLNEIIDIIICIFLIISTIYHIYQYFTFKIITVPTIDLISIALVAEDGREYYAISKDFNLDEAWNRWQPESPDFYVGDGKKYWIRENVLKPIFDEWKSEHNGKVVRLGLPIPLNEMKFTYKNFKYFLNKNGKTNEQISKEIKWFSQAGVINKTNKRDNPQFYGYYADYDWVVFCWLFGKMIDLPKGFPKYCNDLKQELDNKVKAHKFDMDSYSESTKRELSMKPDFDKKLNIIKSRIDYPKQTNEHNALADARWNKKLHEFLNTL